MDHTDNQLRKLRRRVEEFLRNTTPEMLIRIADLCKIKVPDNLRKRYVSPNNDES
jgi:hypothetical protein